MANPILIQGGMGVAVSDWHLARAVAQTGQLGVVSGTALAVVLIRRLQQGDPGGHMARALGAFPLPAVSERIWKKYFVPGGKAPAAPFALAAMPSLRPDAATIELTVLANFAEVWLAKEGHAGVVGINFLEKIQLPTLPSLYGAMLAQADYVLMGAGIPRSIPGVIDQLTRGEAVELKINVTGATAEDNFTTTFDPRSLFAGPAPQLPRPRFLAIISSATLALTLARKSNGRVDGFVVEGAMAGGHNAPPRGAMQLTPAGEPLYGPRDVPELAKIRDLGLPFWIAGAHAHPQKLATALALGAAGIQVGTLFAFCTESGLDSALKSRVIAQSRREPLEVFTDPFASPTGFPFKVLQLGETLSTATCYAARERICDLGYLREVYRKADGTAGYRCGGEPVEDFLRKGGTEEGTVGRKCLCNGLMATAGFAQTRGGSPEAPILTAGDEIIHLARHLPADAETYSAAEMIRWLIGENVERRESAVR